MRKKKRSNRKPRITLSFNLYELEILYKSESSFGSLLRRKIDRAYVKLSNKTLCFVHNI